MTKNRKLGWVVVLMSMVGLCAVAGCLTIPSWLEIVDSGGAIVTGQEVVVASGQDFTFWVQGSDSLALERTRWRVEEGQYRGKIFGHSYSNTFVNTSGSVVTYKIMVTGYCGGHHAVVEESFTVKVTPSPSPPVVNPPEEPQCRLNSDCEANQHCAGEVCVDNQPPEPECQLNSDCPAGQHCDGKGNCTSNLPSALVITSVAFSPVSQPFHVGQQVTVVVKHTGSGTIHHLLVTSTVVGSVTAEADGETRFTYTWPFPASGLSHFWPDDRDSPPNLISLQTKVE
jgi:hypothetical protein